LTGYKKSLARLTEKWHVKVLSVVVAIFLFAFHRMGDLQERFFSVPLTFRLDSGLVPAGPFPRTIRITLRGDANSIYPVGETGIEAFVDLSMYTEPGIYRVPVQVQKAADLETEDLEILVEPMEISIELDAKMSRYVPISPAFKGYLESGYEMVSYDLDPPEAAVEGPVKILSKIPELSTESIDLRSRSGDFSSRVRIINPNPLLEIRGDGMTEFTGFVRELIMITNLADIPVSVTGLAPFLEADLNPPAASIRVLGIQRAIDALDKETILGVDCSALTEPGIYEVPLTVFLGEELTLERTDPETIQVTLYRRTEEE
jgi:YbbR domain-containing protein